MNDNLQREEPRRIQGGLGRDLGAAGLVEQVWLSRFGWAGLVKQVWLSRFGWTDLVEQEVRSLGHQECRDKEGHRRRAVPLLSSRSGLQKGLGTKHPERTFIQVVLLSKQATLPIGFCKVIFGPFTASGNLLWNFKMMNGKWTHSLPKQTHHLMMSSVIMLTHYMNRAMYHKISTSKKLKEQGGENCHQPPGRENLNSTFRDIHELHRQKLLGGECFTQVDAVLRGLYVALL